MIKQYQNSVIAQLLEAIISQVNFNGEPISNIGDILLSILEQTPYDKEPKSVLAELFLKLKDKLEGRAFTPYDKEPKSALAEILLSILNETEYDKEPNSRIAELLLELKAELENYAELTASGAIANFTTSVVKPLVNLAAYFNATQEAGTPTPSEPKAISGVSAVNIGCVDMNQKIKNGNFVNNSDWSTSGATFSVSDNIATLLATNSGGGLYQVLSLTEGHAYLFKANVKTTTQTNKIRMCANRQVSPYDLSEFYSQNSPDWQELVIIKKPYYTGSYQFRILDMRTADFDDVKIENIICIDLTQAFGEKIANYLYALPDNGLSLIKQLFTKDYYPYNAGGSIVTLDSVNGEPTCPNAVINLGGTYYGGYVTQDKNGKRELVVNRKKITLDGSQAVNVSSASYIKSDACDGYIINNDIYPLVAISLQPDDLKSNKLTFEKYGIWASVGYPNCFCINRNQIHVNIANDLLGITDYTQETVTTVENKITSFLTNNPIEFVIPIEEFEIELPDGEPITAFNGVNNVYNDSGDTSVTYLALISDNITRSAKARATLKAEKLKAKEIEEQKEQVVLDPVEVIKEKPTKGA